MRCFVEGVGNGHNPVPVTDMHWGRGVSPGIDPTSLMNPLDWHEVRAWVESLDPGAAQISNTSLFNLLSFSGKAPDWVKAKLGHVIKTIRDNSPPLVIIPFGEP